MQHLLHFPSGAAVAHLSDLLSYVYHNRRPLALMETQDDPIVIGNGEHIALDIDSREAYGGKDLLFLKLGAFIFYFTPEQSAISISLEGTFSIGTYFSNEQLCSLKENDWRVMVLLARTIQGAMAQHFAQSLETMHGNSQDEYRVLLDKTLKALL